MWLKGVIPFDWREEQGPMPLEIGWMADDGTPLPNFAEPVTVGSAGPATLTLPARLYDVGMNPLPTLTVTPNMAAANTWNGYLDLRQTKPNPPGFAGEPFVRAGCGLKGMTIFGNTNMVRWTPIHLMPPPPARITIEDNLGNVLYDQAFPAAGGPVKQLWFKRNGQQIGGTLFS